MKPESVGSVCQVRLSTAPVADPPSELATGLICFRNCADSADGGIVESARAGQAVAGYFAIDPGGFDVFVVRERHRQGLLQSDAGFAEDADARRAGGKCARAEATWLRRAPRQSVRCRLRAERQDRARGQREGGGGAKNSRASGVDLRLQSGPAAEWSAAGVGQSGLPSEHSLEHAACAFMSSNKE